MKIIDLGERFGMATANIFSPLDPTIMIPRTIEDLEKMLPQADLVCLGGGADIHPKVYGHANVASYAERSPSFRDLFESAAVDLVFQAKKPLLGICRGAQMLCVKNGGWLIQDIGGHAGQGGWHDLETEDGHEVPMTSYHHQMMYPFDVEHKLIAWTKATDRARYSYDNTQVRANKVNGREPEIVLFPQTNSLAIQGHPEFHSSPMEAPVVYTRKLVEQYLLKKAQQ